MLLSVYVDKQGKIYHDDEEKNDFNDRTLCYLKEHLASAV
jgi:hypothetical protein